MNDDYGWIQLHRKLIQNPIFDNAELLRLFIYCLLRANHEPDDIIFNKELVKIKRGQFLTGRKVIAKALKQNENTIYTRLKLLEKLGYIKLNSNNKFSILTIVKYEDYQSDKRKPQQPNNNGSTTAQQPNNTNNNDNNEDNEKEEPLTIDTLEILFQSIFNKFPQDIKMGEDVCRQYFFTDISTKKDFEIFENSYKAMERTTSKDYTPKPANFFRDWRKYKPTTIKPQKGVIYLDKD